MKTLTTLPLFLFAISLFSQSLDTSLVRIEIDSLIALNKKLTEQGAYDEALTMMESESTRVATLQDQSAKFLQWAKEAKLEVGTVVEGSPVVVVIVGSTVKCVRTSMKLAEHGINVKPIVYPAVEEGKCRLRFFISSLRTDKEIRHTIDRLQRTLMELDEGV